MNKLVLIAACFLLTAGVALGQEHDSSAEDGGSLVHDRDSLVHDRDTRVQQGGAPGNDAALPPHDSDSLVQHVYVDITTNAADAVLFADSTYLGRVPTGLIAVPAATSELRLAVEDVNTWSIPPVQHQLDAEPGDTLSVDLSFPYHYRVESIPFGAKVHVVRGDDWEYIGATPLLHTSDEPLDGRLAIERSGYVVERMDAGTNVWNRHVIMLKPSDDLDPTAAQVNWRPPKKHRAWIDYAALGTALAAGVVAIHYKFKADDLYSRYEDTADQAMRDEIHAYDVRSGVAFGVMQAGVGLFAIRLVLR